MLENIKRPLKYDSDFQPMYLFVLSYQKKVKEDPKREVVKVLIERDNQQTALLDLEVFSKDHEDASFNYLYVERQIKTILWLKGGFKITYFGPKYLFDMLQDDYLNKDRRFDYDFMSKVYQQPFSLTYVTSYEGFNEVEHRVELSKNLDGNRIGFDLGGSDMKISCVVNGESIFSEEIVWYPKVNENPDYHYEMIRKALNMAKEKMPQVDAIGISSAGIFVDNEVRVASLFLKVPEAVYQEKITPIYKVLTKELADVPMVVANDGDVTALAGSMSLGVNSLLGIAMGTSEAAGYIDHEGKITGWLNELAFVPMDINPTAMEDEWSHDIGCGVKYLSQDGVIKLAESAGIDLSMYEAPAEKLKHIQQMHQKGSEVAENIFETVGAYLGYAVLYYSLFYDIKHVLILGRVTSGIGGHILLQNALDIIKKENKVLFDQLSINLPDEKSRRVGQSIAAASLPTITK